MLFMGDGFLVAPLSLLSPRVSLEVERVLCKDGQQTNFKFYFDFKYIYDMAIKHNEIFVVLSANKK